MEDAGRYTLKCNEASTQCVLKLDEKKCTYHFNQQLPKTAEVVRNKDIILECSVSDPRAHVTWYHNSEKIEVCSLLILYLFSHQHLLYHCSTCLAHMKSKDEKIVAFSRFVEQKPAWKENTVALWKEMKRFATWL